MKRVRLNSGRILVPALLSLLLCGIVAAEFPELLSLTDNTVNDFTVRAASSLVLPALPHAGGPVRIVDIDSATPASALLFSRLRLFEMAALLTPEPLILHCILRM